MARGMWMYRGEKKKKQIGSGSTAPVLILGTVTTTERKRHRNPPSHYLPIESSGLGGTTHEKKEV